MAFSGYVPGSGIAGSYGSSIFSFLHLILAKRLGSDIFFFFSFLRNLHTLIHSGCELHSQQFTTIYIPTNSVRGFPFLQTLPSIFYL